MKIQNQTGKMGVWTASAISACLVASAAHAGTYNFYFNNTEQGDGSTANPSVGTVGDPNTPQARPSGLPTSANADSKPSESASASRAGDFLAFDTDTDSPKWRLGFTGFFIPQTSAASGQGSYCGDSGCYESISLGPSSETKPGAAVGLTYFPLPWFGLSLYGGAFHRADESTQGLVLGEIEILPIRLSIAGIQDVFELGLLAGGNNIDERRDGSWTATHVGARANVNLSRHIGVTAAARFAPFFLGGEAGLVLRL